MKKPRFPIGLVALAAVAVAAPAAGKGRAGIDQAGWLAGTWVAETGEQWTQENWAPPRGGVMVGTSVTGKGMVASSYEYMRIALDSKGRLVFWGSPEGKPPVPFPAADGGPKRLVFENPAHDYPTRITYRRDGDRLIATISGPNGANPMRWTYRRR